MYCNFSAHEKSGLESALERSFLLKERSSECRREFFARPGPPPTTINFVIPPEGDGVFVEDEVEDVPNEVGHLYTASFILLCARFERQQFRVFLWFICTAFAIYCPTIPLQLEHTASTKH